MPAPTGANDRPVNNIVVQDVAIRQIGDKAVLMLKAPTGATGTTDVTITARDAQGNEFTQTITVRFSPIPSTARPFLSSYPSTRANDREHRGQCTGAGY